MWLFGCLQCWPALSWSPSRERSRQAGDAGTHCICSTAAAYSKNTTLSSSYTRQNFSLSSPLTSFFFFTFLVSSMRCPRSFCAGSWTDRQARRKKKAFCAHLGQKKKESETSCCAKSEKKTLHLLSFCRGGREISKRIPFLPYSEALSSQTRKLLTFFFVREFIWSLFSCWEPVFKGFIISEVTWAISAFSMTTKKFFSPWEENSSSYAAFVLSDTKDNTFDATVSWIFTTQRDRDLWRPISLKRSWARALPCQDALAACAVLLFNATAFRANPFFHARDPQGGRQAGRQAGKQAGRLYCHFCLCVHKELYIFFYASHSDVSPFHLEEHCRQQHAGHVLPQSFLDGIWKCTFWGGQTYSRVKFRPWTPASGLSSRNSCLSKTSHHWSLSPIVPFLQHVSNFLKVVLYNSVSNGLYNNCAVSAQYRRVSLACLRQVHDAPRVIIYALGDVVLDANKVIAAVQATEWHLRIM